jgi:3-hydroxyisobutyrate dehydrogenase-like beta-hydroxyacid dehydrogenase
MAATVGFMGLGSMGAPMVRNLMAKGYALRVYNRTAEKARAFAEEGAVVCETPGEAAQGAEFVVTMLDADASVEQVTVGDEGILTSLAPGGIHLSCSTIGPDTSRRLAALHDLHDSVYLTTPVFGRPEAATAAKLNILVSGGDAVVRAHVRPVLEAMGQAVWDFGDEPGAANVVKLCGNFLILAATEAMAEAFTLAEKNGVDRTAVYEMLTQTVFNCPVYQGYGRMVASQVFEPVGFSLPLGLKDIRLVEEVGRTSQTPLPVADLVDQRMVAALAKGRGHFDAAAFALEASEAAGLRREQ